MTKEEANVKLEEMVKLAEEALSLCEKFADEHALEFSINPAYGMGGTYFGAGHEEISEWLKSELDLGEGEGGWYASSQSC